MATTPLVSLTQIHRVWALQDSAAAAAEPARRNAVYVKVSYSRESAQVEHTRTCILLNDVCVLVSLVFSERELMFMFAICRRPSVCRL